jgi:hypothetical protein
MDTETKNKYEKVIESLREPGDISVGFILTYDLLRMWLIKPTDQKGCGFDSGFVDKLLPMILQNIIDGHLKFEVGHHEFEMYCKSRCQLFNDAMTKEGAKVREKLMHEEFLNQQKNGLILLAEMTDRIKTLKRWRLWLSIFMPLLPMVPLILLTEIPQKALQLLLRFFHLGVF